MGYTNHILYPAPNPQQTERVISDIEALIENSNTALDVNRGEGWISFNGSRQWGAEPFRWPTSKQDEYVDGHPDQCEEWCKTYRRKYDAVVLAAMLAVKHHLPGTVVDTDDAHSLESVITDCVRNPTNNRGCRSVVELVVKMRWNEFSPQHQKALALYRKTFPDRDIAAILPWQSVT